MGANYGFSRAEALAPAVRGALLEQILFNPGHILQL